MSATTQTVSLQAPQKLSRYRTLRGKSISETRTTAVGSSPKEQVEHSTTSIFKSASRYRKRSKTVGSGDDVAQVVGPPPPVPTVPPLPSLPLAQTQPNIWSRAAEGRGTKVQPNSGSVQHDENRQVTRAAASRMQVASAVSIATGAASPPDCPIEESREQRSHQPSEEAERRHRDAIEAARWANEVARLEAETDRILAEQKRKDLARLQAELDAAALLQQQAGLHAGVTHKLRSPVLEKFIFLTRGRRSNAATLSPTSSTCASVDFSRATSLEPNLLPRDFIEPGGRVIVPQTDAPMSASNSAERRVVVRCRGAANNLPVLLDTTVVDILFGCSDQMTHPINTSTSIAIEVYSQLGLERRLRRYERVRDIMNSWDRDTQNSILVLPDSFESDKDLDLANVPRTNDAPKGFILQLWYSQRPGKWNKRFVTLLESGQMFSSKKPDRNPTDKDVQSLCHMSDFDIYTPTEAQMRKQLKPPKKYCYAVKSQQKTTVFLNTENFVHFFCTEDPNVAHKFHSLVHAWRSWFLVNRTLQTTERRRDNGAEKPPQIVPLKHKPKKSISHVKVQGGHKLKVSVDESPYAIGAFQPLLDLKRFDKPLDEFGKDWEPDQSRYSVRTAEKSGITVAAHAGQATGEAFAADGLLGDSYDKRKQSQWDHMKETKGQPAPADSPTKEVPPSIATVTVVPVEPEPEKKPEPGWFPSAVEHTARQRSQSLRNTAAAPSVRPGTSAGPMSQHERLQALHQLQHLQQQQQPHHQQQQSQRREEQRPKQQQQQHPTSLVTAPLVNLEPRFQEAPQWSREGRGQGHGVKAPPGTRLVDLATTPATPGTQRLPEAPPRNPVRRPEQPVARPQTSDGQGRSRARSVTGEVSPFSVPPVPPLPTRVLARDGAFDPGAGGRMGAEGVGSGSRGPSPPIPEGTGVRDPSSRAVLGVASGRGRSGTVRY